MNPLDLLKSVTQLLNPMSLVQKLFETLLGGNKEHGDMAQQNPSGFQNLLGQSDNGSKMSELLQNIATIDRR